MDELEELQRQLESVQVEEVAHKLSERNIVDLMEQLAAREKIDLLHSMNGKEYLTSDHLGTEILTELRKAGGRLNTIELPKLLDVGAEHIGKQVEYLAKRDKRHLFAINDSLFTSSYLDTVAAEIEATLGERGSITISELSTSYDLPVDYLRLKLNEWIDEQKLRGKMHGVIVYKDSYVAREKCRVRGYILGTTRPVSISQAASDLQMEDGLLKSLLEDLIRAGEVHCKLQSDLVVPESFERSQKNIVKLFYQQNHYLQYSQLAKIMVRKPKEYLKTIGLEGTHLSKVFVDNSLISQVDSHMSDIVASPDSYLDLYTDLPQSFDEDDLKIFLSHCVASSSAIIFKHFVAGQKYMDNCLSSLKDLAAKYVSTLEEEKKKQPTKKQAKAESPAGGKRKKKRGGKAAEGDEETEEDRKIDLGLTPEVVAAELKKSPKILKDRAEEDEDFLSALAEHLYADIRQLYEEAYKEFFKSKKQPTKVSIQQLEGEIQKEFHRLQLAVRSLDVVDKLTEKGISSDEKKRLDTMLVTYIVKKQGNAVLNYCVVQQLIYSGVDIASAIKDKQIAALTVQERDNLVKMVPKTLIATYIELGKLISDRDIREFLNKLVASKATMAISAKLLDKKAEKVLRHELVQGHKDAIAKEQDDIQALVYNALCLTWMDAGVVIPMPNEVWALVIMARVARLSGKADAGLLDMVDVVERYVECVKVEKTERDATQTEFLKDFDAKKEGRANQIKELFKIAPAADS